MSESVVAYDADADGRELKVGQRVEILSSGERGRIRHIAGNYVVVEEDSGHATRLAARDVRAFERTSMSVSMAASAICPYCSKSVLMSRGILGGHRVPGGDCDGSGRVVASLTRAGTAVFAAIVGER